MICVKLSNQFRRFKLLRMVPMTDWDSASFSVVVNVRQKYPVYPIEEKRTPLKTTSSPPCDPLMNDATLWTSIFFAFWITAFETGL